MRFEYKLSGLGWANGYMEVNGEICYFTASYLTDALYDFLNSILSVIPDCVPDDELKQSVSFQFYAEPSGTDWRIQRQDDGKLRIQIVSYEDIDLKLDPKIEFECYIPLLEFLEVVIRELDLLIKTHGIVGYRECWYDYDFPLTPFLKLKQYLITQSNYEVIEYKENGWNGSKTILEKDIQLLLKELK